MEMRDDEDLNWVSISENDKKWADLNDIYKIELMDIDEAGEGRVKDSSSFSTREISKPFTETGHAEDGLLLRRRLV